MPWQVYLQELVLHFIVSCKVNWLFLVKLKRWVNPFIKLLQKDSTPACWSSNDGIIYRKSSEVRDTKYPGTRVIWGYSVIRTVRQGLKLVPGISGGGTHTCGFVVFNCTVSLDNSLWSGTIRWQRAAWLSKIQHRKVCTSQRCTPCRNPTAVAAPTLLGPWPRHIFQLMNNNAPAGLICDSEGKGTKKILSIYV